VARLARGDVMRPGQQGVLSIVELLMIRTKQLYIIAPALLCLSLIVIEIANADQCEKLEREERLIHQQFKKSKICRDSKIGKGWTDCEFTAYEPPCD
jgi:hypothetical protein